MPLLHSQFLEDDRRARTERVRSRRVVPFGAGTESMNPVRACCRASDPCMRCYRCEKCCTCEGGQQDATSEGWKARKQA